MRTVNKFLRKIKTANAYSEYWARERVQNKTITLL